ncbi:formylglycine-generating enzyme family protein [Verrucomicrobiota bacterium]
MKKLFAGMLVLLILLAGSASAPAQGPVIESFDNNGELVCTGLLPGSTCRVEWATSPDGVWSNFTVLAGLDGIEVRSNGTIRVRVPVFYQVRGIPGVFTTTTGTTATSVTTTTATTTTADMVLIPAGEFEMGNGMRPDEGEDDELPLHTVYVSAFYIDRYEVTKAKWDEVAFWANNNRYDVGPSDAHGSADDHPVRNITWYECVKWCNARSQMEGLTACYTVSGGVYRIGEEAPECNWSATGYRLPTEAEWEKAARGGLPWQRFPWGPVINHDYANYQANGSAFDYDTSPYTSGTDHPDGHPTTPGGTFASNGYGLYDMVGNLREWCWDWWYDEYYDSSPGSDPRGPASASSRVNRGGSWYSHARESRVAYRGHNEPDVQGDKFGFRTVLPAHQ